MAARRVVEDFAAVYGIRPVLAETFVAPEYRGSCFLAAGWLLHDNLAETHLDCRAAATFGTSPPKP